ncbi:MAG: peptidyl-prolyl cis-trans isomerase [Myxococcales bacterium]|nr:peptidyl-prolyl cis-trans isomerase [Myxococcales bacterium]
MSDTDRPAPLWRLLARFFVGGALLLAARQAVQAVEPERRPLAVEVSSGATEPEVAAATDEAILLDFAIRAGWHRTDTVVRERLLSSLAVAGEKEEEPRVAVDRAIALGLHVSDPIARRRLVEVAERALEHADEEPEPTQDELRAHVDAHRDDYRTPGRVRFRQVFLSTERRGAGLADAVTEIAERLRATPEVARDVDLALSDPWPWSDTRAGESPARLEALFGEEFGRALAGARPGRWEGPVRSSFGVHFVFVEAVDAPDDPPLASVHDRVRAAVLRERRAARRAQRMAALRREYVVSVVRSA